tara:strand:- start:135 stop:1403 length:1269 start_codon:yes stop_codon:yes gene_type:complete
MTLVSFQDIYQWKNDNPTYLDEDLQFHVYDLLDTINEEILRKNKELMKDRYKNNHQYKKKVKHNNRKSNQSVDNKKTNWREDKKIGLKSFLKNVDKFELSLNMELNKISTKNIDIIVDGIKDIFIIYLATQLESEITNIEGFVSLNEKINHSITDDKINVYSFFKLESVLSSYHDYQMKLWNNIMNKICFQDNLVELYFKFIHKLLLIKHADIIDKLEIKLIEKVKENVDINISRLQQVINLITNYLRKNNNSVIISFHSYNKFKNKIIEECIEFNRNQKYFQNKNNDLYQNLKLENINNIPHQSIFYSLGKFVKYFTELNKKDKLGDLYDVLLISTYDNLKILNEMLQWEPYDLVELDKRVNLMIGFLENNTKFIKGLDTYFYHDIECELEMIKKYKNIPTSIKYKLFDCIDNFIITRNKK